jgi:hypothetical protein
VVCQNKPSLYEQACFWKKNMSMVTSMMLWRLETLKIEEHVEGSLEILCFWGGNKYVCYILG